MSDVSYRPGPKPRTVWAPTGEIVPVPENWELLPPGDATLTRRAKAAGPFWLMTEKRGRKVFSHGLWTDAATIARIRAELEQERSTEQYAKRQEAGAKRREKIQTEYVGDFSLAILAFLKFAPRYSQYAHVMTHAVAEHATPVGSGTVARTKRIPIEDRAEAAVIAWMRHQTTAYDEMKIAPIKGKRREVRRELARQSHMILNRYRTGQSIAESCPLQQALISLGVQPIPAAATATTAPQVRKPLSVTLEPEDDFGAGL